MRKNLIRGVTPAIATMILITATLVLALVFGAYSSSLFRPSVNQVQLISVLLYDGATSDNLSKSASASLTLVIKNPDLTASISALKLSSTALEVPVTSWSLTAMPQYNSSLFAAEHNLVVGGTTTAFVLYPIHNPSVSLPVGATFEYFIQFSNGQSIFGDLIAQ